MNWEIIASLITTIIGSNLLVVILNRQANKRKAEAEADRAKAEAEAASAQVNAEEWHLYREQLEAAQRQIMFLNERIVELLKLNAEKETRFGDQTERLRDTQRREQAKTDTIIKLTEENGNLRLELKDHRCVKLDCIDRKPENDHTKRAKALANIRQSKAKQDEGTN